MLVERGAHVVALVRDSVPKSLFFDPAPTWSLDKKTVTVRGEIENAELLLRILNEYEIDTVFHLAAQTIVGTANRNPLSTFQSNIQGTWNLLEAARLAGKRIERVVIASSDKAYGNLKGERYDETHALAGSHPYDVSKSCADLIAQAYFQTYSLPVSITRCGNFFGAGDLNFSRLIPGTIRDVLHNRNPVIRSDGKHIRDYIYARDGAHAYLRLAEAMVEKPSETIGQAFNFSYGLRLSAAEVAHRVLSLMNRDDLKLDIRNEANNEIPVQSLDSEKAKRVLDWKPRHGFDEGLVSTIAWYDELFSAKAFASTRKNTFYRESPRSLA